MLGRPVDEMRGNHNGSLDLLVPRHTTPCFPLSVHYLQVAPHPTSFRASPSSPVRADTHLGAQGLAPPNRMAHTFTDAPATPTGVSYHSASPPPACPTNTRLLQTLRHTELLHTPAWNLPIKGLHIPLSQAFTTSQLFTTGGGGGGN